VQGLAKRKVAATIINLIVGVIVPLLLFTAAVRLHLHLKSLVGSLEFAPANSGKYPEPEGLKGLVPLPTKGVD
jgi:hypothetical protein